MGETRSALESRADDRPARGEPHLFAVNDAIPARFALGAYDEVAVGRGDAREIAATKRSLGIALVDDLMSRKHARFVRVLDRWAVEDLGSKNGTVVEGASIGKDRRVLADGDVIELGRTFFVYRSSMVAFEGTRTETLVPDLCRRFAELDVIAKSTVSIVIRGEVGTGKEVIARAIHAHSGRSGDYVVVNCAAIPANLVESELFGYKKGAFSGAVEDRPGLVRAADKGTLVLDEIGELPLPAQAAMLRVLQEHEVVPVGATRPVPVDLRVVAATHRDLPAMVEAGTFRADLYSRLAGFALALPPLRERVEDLGLIVGAEPIATKAWRALLDHAWPGNIRELVKTIETARVLAQGAPIALEHLPDALRAPPAESTEPDRAKLEALLREHGGNVAAVARALDKAPMQVRRWMKRFALDPDAYR